ncbi:MAG TPA: ABC transporter permease [Gemmatimonadaceae bacterium]|nr:ABC transporter permease [Gemmatimonadaceae bacterium]
MTGFGAFMQKELTEIRRTWRLWVIPGILVFFGVTSPIIAALTPALLRSMTASQPGVVIRIPTPGPLDSFVQFLKALDQFVLIAVVITGAGAVSGERGSGTAILALTKPLSRGAFVVAKILSQLALIATSTALGTAVCLVMTALVFDGAFGARLVTAVALWIVYAALLVVVMTLFSATFRSRGAAAGAGLGFYFLTLLLGTWGPMARFGFPGLMPAMGNALVGKPLAAAWPVATAVVAIVAGALAAVAIFERQEL